MIIIGSKYKCCNMAKSFYHAALFNKVSMLKYTLPTTFVSFVYDENHLPQLSDLMVVLSKKKKLKL